MRLHHRLVAQGVLLLHFTPGQIRSAPEEVITQIRGGAGGGAGAGAAADRHTAGGPRRAGPCEA